MTKKVGIAYIHLVVVITLLILTTEFVRAQELEPRSLANVPVGTSFGLVSYGFTTGNILYDPALNLDNLHASVHSATGLYVRAFDFFGMSAKYNIILPLVNGHWDGTFEGGDTETSRSGLADARVSFSFNFIGSPAYKKEEFANYHQETISGMSFQLIAPTGQYHKDRLINIGSNRWAFKTQYGISHHINNWFIEAAANVWVFSKNKQFLNDNTVQQKPLGVVKLHFIRSFENKMWAALGLAYAFGGTSYLNNNRKDTYLSTMRLGLVVSVPVNATHSFKVVALTARRFEQGADFDSLSLAYQFAWN